VTEDPITLKHFFASDASKPIAGELDLKPVMAAVAGATAALPAQAMTQISDGLQSAFDSILAVNAGDVLQASWGKVMAVRDAILATRKDPAATALVPLLDHKITSKHSPQIDVTLGGKTLLQIPIDISLSLALKGAVLDIRQGRLFGVSGGSCVGDGVLAFAGKTLLQRKSPEFALPGRLNFTAPQPDNGETD